MIEAEVGEAALGLTVLAISDGAPLSGEVVEYLIGDSNQPGYFVDFNDNTFKNVGWIQKTGTMTEDANEAGLYGDTWDSSTAVFSERRLFVLYKIVGGLNASQFSEDLIFKRSAYIRKLLSNKMILTDALAGNYTIYDDDDVTPVAIMTIRDPDNLAIILQTGMQANRTKATP